MHCIFILSMILFFRDFTSFMIFRRVNCISRKSTSKLFSWHFLTIFCQRSFVKYKKQFHRDRRFNLFWNHAVSFCWFSDTDTVLRYFFLNVLTNARSFCRNVAEIKTVVLFEDWRFFFSTLSSWTMIVCENSFDDIVIENCLNEVAFCFAILELAETFFVIITIRIQIQQRWQWWLEE